MIIHTKKDTQPFSERSSESPSELVNIIDFENENLVCIAGSPGIGKTALALHVALEYAKTHSKTVYIFSSEMLAEHIIDRLLIMLSEVDSHSFRQKTLSSNEKGRVELARKQLSGMDIVIDDTSFLSVAQIKEKLSESDSIGLVVIDYVQLLTCENRMSSRMDECYEISRQLKELSEHLNLPIIFTSPIPRGVEYREDKRPRLNDLKDVGVFEEYVDTVCLIYRDGCYAPFESFEQAEIIIPKSKYSSRSTVTLEWQGRFMNFVKTSSD